jgi:hypothetical protein
MGWVQPVPSATGVYTQLPVDVLQVSDVQALESLQVFAVWLQTPVVLLQESVVQAFASSQFVAVPVQAPPTQASPEVQALLSVQASPSLIAV